MDEGMDRLVKEWLRLDKVAPCVLDLVLFD